MLLRKPARSMRKSFSVRSAIETPLQRSSRSMTASCSLQQLLAAVLQVVHLVAGLLLDDVLLAGRGDVEQHHAAADALFEVDVFLQLHVGPEVDELDALVGRADAVDAAEALDDADRVPVDVVVDECRSPGGFGPRRCSRWRSAGRSRLRRPGPPGVPSSAAKGGEDAGEVLAQLGQRRLVAAGAGDEGGVQPKLALAPTGQVAR